MRAQDQVQKENNGIPVHSGENTTEGS